MAVLTERISVSLPVEVTARLRERADRKGISLSALMREILDDIIIEHDLRIAIAAIERKDATVQ